MPLSPLDGQPDRLHTVIFVGALMALALVLIVGRCL